MDQFEIVNLLLEAVDQSNHSSREKHHMTTWLHIQSETLARIELEDKLDLTK